MVGWRAMRRRAVFPRSLGGDFLHAVRSIIAATNNDQRFQRVDKRFLLSLIIGYIHFAKYNNKQ